MAPCPLRSAWSKPASVSPAPPSPACPSAPPPGPRQVRGRGSLCSLGLAPSPSGSGDSARWPADGTVVTYPTEKVAPPSPSLAIAPALTPPVDALRGRGPGPPRRKEGLEKSAGLPRLCLPGETQYGASCLQLLSVWELGAVSPASFARAR